MSKGIRESYMTQAEKINNDTSCPFEFLELPKNQKTKVTIRCKVCGNIYKAKPQPIIEWRKLNRGGCMNCYATRKYKGNIENGGIRLHPAYNILDSIKQRCYNPNSQAYHHYGGRGIKVCSDWMDKKLGYVNFINWAEANGYKKGLTIDRIDVNGNYTPDNCRWVPFIEQRENKRKPKKNKTGYRGVHKNGVSYCARVIYTTDDGISHQYDLGCFKTPIQAALTRALFMEKNKVRLKYDLDNLYQMRIIKWGSSRYLYDYDEEAEKAILSEEKRELEDAKNIYEKLDALADCYVVITQSLAKAGLKKIKIEDSSWLKEQYDFYKTIPQLITDLGYSFDCVMEETLLEIESRLQDPKQKELWDNHPELAGKTKWQKWKEQPKETLYKADYSKCKVKS
jgi:hypothetical protein